MATPSSPAQVQADRCSTQLAPDRGLPCRALLHPAAAAPAYSPASLMQWHSYRCSMLVQSMQLHDCMSPPGGSVRGLGCCYPTLKPACPA